MPDQTDDRDYPIGKYISNELLMKAARVLQPLAFKLYVVLLVHGGGSTECWPSLTQLATRMNIQIGAIKRGRKELMEAGLLTLRQASDGLEHYILQLPEEKSEREKWRRERRRSKDRAQVIADKLTADNAALLRQIEEEKKALEASS